MHGFARIGLFNLGVAAVTLTAACENYGVRSYPSYSAATAACGGDEVVQVSMGKGPGGGGYVRRGHYTWATGAADASHNHQYGCRSYYDQIGWTCLGLPRGTESDNFHCSKEWDPDHPYKRAVPPA
jgi:hypothetical protein